MENTVFPRGKEKQYQILSHNFGGTESVNDSKEEWYDCISHKFFPKNERSMHLRIFNNIATAMGLITTRILMSMWL